MFVRRSRRGTAGDTIGIEEEFFLTDVDGVPVPRCAELLEHLPQSFKAELKPSQIEIVTPVQTEMLALAEDLRQGRNELAKAASDSGIVVMPVGTPIAGEWHAGPVTKGDRYRGIEDRYAGTLSDYNVCACQVHIGIEDDELAVAALNHVRPWLPILLAIGANSPFAHGADTGYSSWRIIQQSALPNSGLPPYSESADEYEDRLARLVEMGSLFDDRTSFWIARRSPRYPTLEFRVADAALTVDDAIFQAVFSRALVRMAVRDIERGEEAPRIENQIGSAAVWTAARYGLIGPAIDPVTGESMSAMSRVRELLDYVSPALRQVGDYRLALRLVKKLEKSGTGAARQRAKARRGLGNVVAGFALKPI